MNYREKKVGVLGGGQLGRMMYEEVLKWDMDLYFMDKSRDFPVGKASPNFHIGDFSNFEDVVNFGKDKDILTIEIESVNLEALLHLRKNGVTIHPSPDALKIIKDKGLQKMFYESHEIPSSAFQLFGSEEELKEAINSGTLTYPFVQKVRTGGYDGKGVAVIQNENDLHKLLKGPCLTEDLVPIEKELGIIIARNEEGEIAIYDAVEMVFDPEENLVDYLFAPADISKEISQKARRIAESLIVKFNICGLLAVEFFLTKDGDLLVNEVAPRCHNSGHHTIEAAVTSQFEQHLRGVMNMPLGSTMQTSPAVMVNLLGEPISKGPVNYKGMHECLQVENLHLHFYGKSETKPARKMGHVTILNQDVDKAIEKAKFVKSKIKVSI